MVDAHFGELFQVMQITKSTLYIPMTAITCLPKPVSVRFLLHRLGRNRSVILEIKNSIKETRLVTAWLELLPSGTGWYEIVDF